MAAGVGKVAVAPSFNLAAAVLLVASMSACDRSDASRGFDRALYRADAIEACSTGMRMGGATGEVAERICGCGADHFLAGKSDAELQGLAVEQSQQGLRASVQICLQQTRDLGPLPVELTTARAQPVDSNAAAPDLPAPPGQPDPNAGLSNGSDGPDIDQSPRGPEAPSESRDPARNDVDVSRWRQLPR